MRHLHETGEDHTLCGIARVRKHMGWGRFHVAPASVHVSKARKSDCAECRSIFRARLRDLCESREFFHEREVTRTGG